MQLYYIDSMLNGNGGVGFGANRISGLYYVDGIVLFAANEWSLQDMLHIADIFARKSGWRLND